MDDSRNQRDSTKMSQKRRWIIIALIVFNSLALTQSAYQLFAWPSTAELVLSGQEVRVTYSADGSPNYVVNVPLTVFPFDIELRQRIRFEPVSLASVNLLLLIALITTYLQRPIQFSLRALFIVMTVVAILLLLFSSLEFGF
jgi:hypothetical protein